MEQNVEQELEQNKDKTPESKSGSVKYAFIWGFLSGVFLISLIGTIFFTIVNKKNEQAREEMEQITLNYDTVYLDKESTIDTELLQKLQHVMDLIHQRFSLNEVQDQELIDGMYKGMLGALGDPYSTYYTAAELSSLMSDTSGIYYGIGAYVSIDQDTKCTKISGIIKNSPALEADLRANDIILEVNGVSTYEKDLNEVVSMIKGAEGTVANLTIRRDGKKLEIPVTRGRVESPTVAGEMLEGDIGYLEITEFNDITAKQFREELAQLREDGMKGLILELRGNPGGTLDSVVDVAGQILPEGLIVYTEDKAGKRVDYNSDGLTPFDLPMVVLVDINTASAAEILSGAIQDYGMATLVGTTTYGKGIVQSIISLYDGSAVKITVSSYYTPNGRNIHKTGITPDVELEFDAEAYYAEESVDNQLQKAIEVLKEKMQ